ncbi:hypothetical protein HMPREF0541_01261 [Lacticaseibacillus rhamnosus ATCC 21052]|nr:hypothetical protein HMPREF0541_01261 [Lacticaseibacillus rhamnosus ATCC 21052]
MYFHNALTITRFSAQESACKDLGRNGQKSACKDLGRNGQPGHHAQGHLYSDP